MGSTRLSSTALLDGLGIQYEMIRFEPAPADKSAVRLASLIGEPVASTLKTLVLRGDKNGYFVCVVPGDATLDLEKAATAAGYRQCSLVPADHMMELTGYARGSCSPLGMRYLRPTYVERTAMRFPYVIVAAGEPGTVLRMTPVDLVGASGGRFADLLPS